MGAMEENNNNRNKTLTEEYVERLIAEKIESGIYKTSKTPPMPKRKVKKKQPGPLYIVGMFILFYSIFFSLFSFSDFATLGAFGFFVYLIAKKIWKNKKEYVDTTVDIHEPVKPEKVKKEKAKKEETKEDAKKEEKAEAKEEKPFTTGDPDIDKMIVDKEKAVIEMRRLNAAIEDPTISAQIDHLEEVTTKILNYILEHPNKKTQVNRFFNYYLPTTLKLLNAYDRMDSAGISGMNIDGTKGKVEEMMTTAMDAFDKQLDALFADEALDVATDIKVMENLLRSEGLKDDEIKLTL